MKKPGNHRKMRTILFLIVLFSGIAQFGAGMRWAARSNPCVVAAQGCSLNCSATVPATGVINASIPFSATATPAGCTTGATYSWDFGDGATSAQQNPTHTYTTAGTFTWTLTTSVGGGGQNIDTIAGGLGDGAPARQAPFGTLGAIARDPQGRGVYVADANASATLIRFINTGGSPVTIGGLVIAPGTVRAIAGGGSDFSNENVPGLQVDVGDVTGLAVSANGALVYYVDSTGAKVRAVNVSTAAVTFGGQSILAGRVGTLATITDATLIGLATHPTTGDVYVIDTAPGVNKVLRITNAGTTSVVAGNGASTLVSESFTPGSATNVPLLQPRAVKLDAAGNLYIADSGHGRVIRVTGGNASLVHQFSPIFDTNNLNRNPYPSGLAVVGSDVYVSNGNQHAIWRVTGNVTKIAGNTIVSSGATVGVPCDYSTTNCGDDGAATGAGFKFLGNNSTPPLAGIDSDQIGLFVLDQEGKGRVRFINLSNGAVTVAGLSVAAGMIRTIAGSGLDSPYDGGLATGARFSTPVGVAVDSAGNLWISDTDTDRLRFVNRGANAITLFGGTPSAQTVPSGAIVAVNGGDGDNNSANDTGAGDGTVISATLDAPQGLFTTSQGVYVVDSNGGPKVPTDFTGEDTSLLRFINTTQAPVTIYPGAGANAITVAPGEIKTIAGGGTGGATSGFAKLVTLKGVSDVAVGNGAIYVTESRKAASSTTPTGAVRRIDGNTGQVTTLTNLAGNKEYTGLGFTSDNRLLVANFTDGSVHRENSAGSATFALFGGAGGNLLSVRDVA